MTRELLLSELQPILARLPELDPDDPAGAERALWSLPLAAVEASLREGAAEGWLTPREAGGVRFGRLAKASPETGGFSVDVVVMSGPARGPQGLAAHTHTTGEFDLCFALEGTPAFDGRREAWVVYPRGSRHVPTVTGGTMLIAYFVRDGAIRFE